MSYFAIQDTNIGYIQYVAEADNPESALKAFDDQVGIDPHDKGISVDDWDITELSEAQYQRLKDRAGDDQEAIDYLEGIKAE